jgi:hypothetical protein
MYLGEAGDERPEGFPRLLPHGVEVGLHTMLLVRAGEVCCELRAELSPGLDGSRVRFMSQVRASPVKAT